MLKKKKFSLENKGGTKLKYIFFLRVLLVFL